MPVPLIAIVGGGNVVVAGGGDVILCMINCGDGDGDFLDKLRGASAAMSTWSSIKRGEDVGVTVDECGERPPRFIVAPPTPNNVGTTGGDIEDDVECGDWK